MAFFNTPDQLNAFIETICEKVTRKLLADAFNAAADEYASIWPDDERQERTFNHDSVIIGAVLTLFAYALFRKGKLMYRMSRLYSVDFWNENKTPQQSLLDILQGPGGTQTASFKWILLSLLSERIARSYTDLPKDFIPPTQHYAQHYIDGNQESDITDELTANLINEIIKNLSGSKKDFTLLIDMKVCK